MPCPAAVSAAAAAVWLLAALGPGLSLPAEDNSEAGFTLCSHCFYRQTPPRGASAGPLLRPLCHTLPRGQAFATLSRPNCDTAVYSAFHLSHGWMERVGEEGAELVTEEDDIKVAVPALLRGGGALSHPLLPTDPLLQHWHSVTTLLQSTISPKCSASEGDLYILTGVGGLGAAEDGGEACQTKPLWSAMCCAVPEGKLGFSVGLIRETEEGEKQVSIKELEEMLGVAEMFSEGCGGTDAETAAVVVGLQTEGHPGNIEKMEADAHREETGDEDVAPDAAEDTKGVQDTEEETTLASEPEEANEVTQETSADEVKSTSSREEQADVRSSGAVHSDESAETSADQTVDEQETDANSSSALVYILSTTMSILKAPLRPVFSTVTQLPEQMTYVLKEDLGVLSALPGDAFSLFHLLIFDMLSWMGSAADMLLGVGETCVFSVYYCTSSMLGALMSSCHIGVTGMGTLAGDTVGVFGDTLDNAWWVTKFFGGRMWEQSGGYVGTMMSEMGGQAKALGGGLGKLVWRSGNGVGNVFRMGGGLIMGMVDMLLGTAREAFGQESE